jgi:glycosyltransferase involved in cell wall biosynthesis
MTDISVVIPLHTSKDEHLDVLRRALDSLLHQSIPRSRYEIILIDDGSAIDLRSELSGVTEHAGVIRLFRQPHKGPAAARNEGTRMSQSEIILYLGGDVIVRRNLLETHIDIHKTHPGVALINPIYASGKGMLGKNIIEKDLDECPEGALYEMTTGAGFCTSCISIRKESIENEMFDEHFKYPAYEDTDVGYRLYKKGIRVMITKRTSAIHEHAHSIESLRDRSRKCGEAFVYFMKKHPSVRTDILYDTSSPKFRSRKLLYRALLPACIMVSKIPFPRSKKWSVDMMCKYDFFKGVEKGRS